MLFQTPRFLLLLTALLLGFAIFRRYTARKVILLLASYVFYASWSLAFLPLLLFSTGIDFAVGRLLENEERERRRRLWLLASLTIQLGLLAYFKYAGFFTANLFSALRVAGFHVDTEAWSVGLPVGISFYTFQTLSYTIDVYRRKLPVTRSLLDFGLFVAFFPHLIAGPILRASQFLPQVKRNIGLRIDQETVFLILRGLVKKVLIADNLARFVDGVFSANGAGWPSVVVWAAAVGFTIQVYCDFSGYSDMAIGIARIFGLHLPLNFDRPLFARNPSDFWRRWHISLSSWLRDYLYVPLGGSRRGSLITSRNLFLTMLIGGLWHGASWNFVIWGVFMGMMLVVHRMFREVRSAMGKVKGAEERVGARLLSILAMQYCFVVSMVLFREHDTADIVPELASFVFFDFNLRLQDLGLGAMAFFSSLAIMAVFLAVHIHSRLRGGLDQRFGRGRLPSAAAACLFAGFLLFMFWPSSEQAFVYFQF